MSRQIIINSPPNAGVGDSLFAATNKINANFGELYTGAGVYYPQTPAEIAAGVTPTNYAYPPGNVLRYGIVPNDTSKRAANTAALQALLNPLKTGPTGRLIFPNTTGSDTYYFGGVIACRRGIHIDLMGCTLNNTYTAVAGDINTGFLYSLGDFSVENGSIEIAVDNSAATGSGQAIYLGARGSDNTYFGGNIFDSTQPEPMGNIAARNLRITVNNTGTQMAGAYAIVILGGLQNVLVENVSINGSGTLAGGIYAEFGWANSPGGLTTSQTSHPNNLTFRNLAITNLQMVGGGSDYAAIALVSTYNCLIDGLYVNGAYNGIEWRIGEDYFYVPWANVDDVGSKNTFTVRNIVLENIASTGVEFTGALAASAGGYMYPVISALATPAKYLAQTDLMTFELDGFVIKAAGAGINISGPGVIRNGKAYGTASSGQLIVSDECTRLLVEQVQLLNSTQYGIRANFGGAIWSPARLKQVTVRNCKICGNANGVGIQNSMAFLIENCQIGFNTNIDGSAEAVQADGIIANVNSGASGVVADSCDITVAAGGTAYAIAGTGPAGCDIRNPRGTVSTSGNWNVNGMASDNSTNLASAAAAVNTTDKYLHKRCLNTSTNKEFVAQGSTPTSTWISVDGATTITPA